MRSCGDGLYPGSPLLAVKMLRREDRLVAIEKHPEDAKVLRSMLASFRRTRVFEADGYAYLPTLLPPPERRGLVLIDPPYEAADEFAMAARAVGDVMRRFATGIALVWFPVKSSAAANAFCGEVVQTGARKLLRLDIEAEATAARMGAAGLLVVNPPFGFEADMRAALEAVAPRLGRDGPAKARLKWLVGSE